MLGLRPSLTASDEEAELLLRIEMTVFFDWQVQRRGATEPPGTQRESEETQRHYYVLLPQPNGIFMTSPLSLSLSMVFLEAYGALTVGRIGLAYIRDKQKAFAAERQIAVGLVRR